jgi:hypothetical protein
MREPLMTIGSSADAKYTTHDSEIYQIFEIVFNSLNPKSSNMKMRVDVFEYQDNQKDAE